MYAKVDGASDPHAQAILVVDDDRAVRNVTRRTLQRDGHEILMAQSGSAALDLLQTDGERIALVLLDLTMPGLSGEETFEQLRTLRPSLPVIVCSGLNEDEVGPLFEEARHVSFLHKPFLTSDLRRRVQDILSLGS